MGCGGASATSTTRSTSIPTPTLTSAPLPVVPTATPTSVTCDTLTPGPGALTGVPLPPHTISRGPLGAAGAGYWTECTPGATQASISTFFAAALPQAGWRQWNSQTDNAGGCGTLPNGYWQWTKGDSAIGYSFGEFALPQWQLVGCSLAFAR
ncbi:MAG TPA: hypothetical protein VFY89_01280 [Ktedonobacterales bacterium]